MTLPCQPFQVRRRQAMQLVGLDCESTFARWVARGWLPQPVRLGRENFWHTGRLAAAVDRLHGIRASSPDETRATHPPAPVRKARRAAQKAARCGAS